MLWQELSIELPREYAEPVSHLFGRYGHGLSLENLVNGHVLLRTYLPSTSTGRLARIEVGVHLVRMICPFGELNVKEVEEADWKNAWKAHFTLLKLGRRLVIKPSWIHYLAAEGEVVIELDPGMAFGTGYHPSTQMCLEAFEELVRPDMNVLDLGTGSGILAIAAVKLGAKSVVALDIDPEAVKVARKNIRAACLKDKVRVAKGSLPHPLAPEGRADLAVANISARVVREKAPDIVRALKRGGMLVASGFIEDPDNDLRHSLHDMGFVHIKTYAMQDWAALLLSRDG